ncbi:MAG: stimulus-sensing domain-containing protein [Rhodospirillaceae bacterium]
MALATATKNPDPPECWRDPRRVSPLARRILAVNILALAILVGGALVLGRYQDRMIQTSLAVLHTEARIFAGALGEGAVAGGQDGPRLDADLARRMVRRLVEPTEVRTRLFDADGQLVADSQDVPAGASAGAAQDPAKDGDEDQDGTGLPPPSRWLLHDLERLYETFAGRYPRRDELPVFEEDGPSPPAARVADLARALAGQDSVAPWTTRGGGGLMLTAAMPVRHGERLVGALLLTESGAGIEAAVQSVRVDILHGFGVALLVTVLLSLYLAGTIVGPVRRLALAADRVRRGHGRHREIPDLTARGDEIGDLSLALREMTAALWARMDAIEHFAADVAHELKNPLSSLRSAVETVARISDPARQRPLMAIIEDDVKRLDRLISDIAGASRIDAELSRAEAGPVDLRAILGMLVEIHAATSADEPGAVRLVADLAEGAELTVSGVEGRLVQVFQNLIANAVSFSPAAGTVRLAARRDGTVVEVTVADQGPGIPEGKLEAIFDRFYTERPAGEKFGTHSGLGLSISKQIIDAHHGTIVATNREQNSGAIFTVRLPVRG